MDSSILYLECPLGSLAESPQNISTVITRNTDIISRANEYVVAIQRMRLSLSSVFNWAPTLLLGQSQSPPIQTIYRMVMSYNGVDSPIQYMDLVRTRLDQPVPEVPLAQQPSSLYASVWDQETVLLMLNNWLDAAFNALKAAVGASFPATAQAPYISWDASTETMTMNAFPMSVWDATNPTPTIQIYVGAEFFKYLAGWRITVLNIVPSPSGKDILWQLSRVANNWLDSSGTPTVWTPGPGNVASPSVPRDAATAMMLVHQTMSTPWCFDCALTNILILSNLPTQQEYTSPPLTVGSGIVSNESTPILMDFCADLGATLNASSQPVVYTSSSTIPGARFVELTGANAIRQLQISAAWVDNLGVVRPLQTFSSTEPASLKLVFVRKSALLSGMSFETDFRFTRR